MTPVKLTVETLRNGVRIVRPEGALGTCGFYPKSWELAVVERGDLPVRAFLEANPNFTYEELDV